MRQGSLYPSILQAGQAVSKLNAAFVQKGERSELGKQVYENICAPCWREAIGMGTKVINELRLDLSDPRAQTVWDQNIREFLNLT